MRILLFNKVFIEILAEYFKYSNVFLVKNIAKLLENSGINEHIIKLEEGKQLSFGLIYSLKPIGFEMLKTYIKINLDNNFIYPSKSSTKAFILFD